MLRNECGHWSYAKIALTATLLFTFYLLLADTHGIAELNEHTDNLLMWVYITLGGVWGVDKIKKPNGGIK